MSHTTFALTPRSHASDAGFSLPELMVSMALLLSIVGIVSNSLQQASNTARTTWNRTEMHSGVRGATELLQQEVGQAGLVSLPAAVSTSAAITVGANTVGVTSAAGMFVGEQLFVGVGAEQETVILTAVNTSGNQIAGSFVYAHPTATPVQAVGGFASGIVPPALTNGSTGTVLKLHGDINSDGNMVYIEYTCDTAGHNLYRNVMAWNAATKPALSNSLILLGNIVDNPGGTACFTYQVATVNSIDYVIDVAITLTVQTQQVDPITKQYQRETKTLLNVSPRNVFNVWELASNGTTNRIQPMPPSILNLLH